MADPKDPSAPGDDSGEDTGKEGGAPAPDYSAGSEGPNPDEAELRGDYRSRKESFRQGADEAAAKMRGAAEAAQEHTRAHMDSARSTIGESEDRTISIAVYVLYLAVGITGGISALAGIVLAYVKKDTVDPVLASHFQFQIRTFWIGLATMIVGLVLTIILIGVPILIALAVWWLLRNVVGLIRLLEGKPIADPKAWLI